MALIDLTTRTLTYGTEAERLVAVVVEGATFFVTDNPSLLLEYTGDALGNWLLTKATANSGSSKVSLPQNAEGMLSGGEHLSTLTNPTDLIVNFANGLNGVTVEYKPMDITGLPDATQADGSSMEMYVAFNINIINDVTITGLRHTVSLGTSKTFAFPGSPKPTQMTLSIPSDGVADPLTKAVYTAVEV